MNKYTEKEYWDNLWSKEKRNDSIFFPFEDLINEYLSDEIPLEYLEIGCAPGTFMAWFSKKMNYKVSGIDFSSINLIRNTLKKNDVINYDIIECDFLNFNTEKKYDVVASFGFVEHFEEYSEIIEKHADLVKDNGYLIIEIPNLKYFNGFLFKIFDKKTYSTHNLEVMDIDILANSVTKNNKFEILYKNYYLTCFLMFNENHPWLKERALVKEIFIIIKKIIKKLKLDNIKNKWFSPYMIIIAKRI